MNNRFSFIGGKQGQWRVLEVREIIGSALQATERLHILNQKIDLPPQDSAWNLQCFTSNIRYSTRLEQDQLKTVQPPLDRQEAVRAVLIPIKKRNSWWELAQDQRRAIFEEQSHHTAVGIEYLPRVARRLFHCRDLGEPFDFLTWFEFAPEHALAFDQMLTRMRSSQEWEYVERELEVHVERDLDWVECGIIPVE
ncbi:MAG: chlorite dismutase family protein [Pseudanabaenaceae cyanobacterium bins.68]|nr:chlorite dismutase family protein [Pseudanabaenaceae cyanobacterium bins.68]